MRRLYLGIFLVILSLARMNILLASPTVYIPLGSGNQVIAVDAATHKIMASYTGVENPHGLVATHYLLAAKKRTSWCQ